MPLVDTCHVTCLSYSPLLGGFSIVLSDGRAACLVSTSLKFDPNGVQGVWAAGVEDVTTTAINHKYRLMAFGRDNSHGVVFCIDESTGGLELSHRLALPTRDYPGCPGPVTALRWTPDSTCLAMVWAAGGFSIWSTFGTMIFCNLGWDHGPRISDAVRKSPYNIQDLDWSAEGYQLWCVNGEQRQFTGKKDPDFCPFPDMSEEGPSTPPDYSSHLGDSILVVPFVKSPISVNPAMAGHASSFLLYLQGDDKRGQMLLEVYNRMSQYISGTVIRTSMTVIRPPLGHNLQQGSSEPAFVMEVRKAVSPPGPSQDTEAEQLARCHDRCLTTAPALS